MAQGPEVSMKKISSRAHGLQHVTAWDERKWGKCGCERSYNLQRQWEGKENLRQVTSGSFVPQARDQFVYWNWGNGRWAECLEDGKRRESSVGLKPHLGLTNENWWDFLVVGLMHSWGWTRALNGSNLQFQKGLFLGIWNGRKYM